MALFTRHLFLAACKATVQGQHVGGRRLAWGVLPLCRLRLPVALLCFSRLPQHFWQSPSAHARKPSGLLTGRPQQHCLGCVFFPRHLKTETSNRKERVMQITLIGVRASTSQTAGHPKTSAKHRPEITPEPASNHGIDVEPPWPTIGGPMLVGATGRLNPKEAGGHLWMVSHLCFGPTALAPTTIARGAAMQMSICHGLSYCGRLPWKNLLPLTIQHLQNTSRSANAIWHMQGSLCCRCRQPLSPPSLLARRRRDQAQLPEVPGRSSRKASKGMLQQTLPAT